MMQYHGGFSSSSLPLRIGPALRHARGSDSAFAPNFAWRSKASTEPDGARGTGQISGVHRAVAAVASATVIAARASNQAPSKRCRKISRLNPCGALPLSAGNEALATRDPPLGNVAGSVLLLMLAMLYGGNVPLLKVLKEDLPGTFSPCVILAMRFSVASLMVLPWAAMNRRKMMLVIRPAAELAVWLFVAYLLQMTGLQGTTASVCSMAAASTGAFVLGLQRSFEGKAAPPLIGMLSLGTMIGVGIFFGGAAETAINANSPPAFLRKAPESLRLIGHFQPSRFLSGVPGEALILVGTFFFALHVWRCSRVVTRGDQTGNIRNGDFEVAVGVCQILLMTVLCVCFCFVGADVPIGEQLSALGNLPSTFFLKIFVCGAICTAIPAVFELLALQVVEPSVASLIYCTCPLWGALIGVIFLNDPFTSQSLVGGVIVLVCSLAPSILEMFKVPQILADRVTNKGRQFENYA